LQFTKFFSLDLDFKIGVSKNQIGSVQFRCSYLRWKPQNVTAERWIDFYVDDAPYVYPDSSSPIENGKIVEEEKEENEKIVEDDEDEGKDENFPELKRRKYEGLNTQKFSEIQGAYGKEQLEEIIEELEESAEMETGINGNRNWEDEHMDAVRNEEEEINEEESQIEPKNNDENEGRELVDDFAGETEIQERENDFEEGINRDEERAIPNHQYEEEGEQVGQVSEQYQYEGEGEGEQVEEQANEGGDQYEREQVEEQVEEQVGQVDEQYQYEGEGEQVEEQADEGGEDDLDLSLSLEI